MKAMYRPPFLQPNCALGFLQIWISATTLLFGVAQAVSAAESGQKKGRPNVLFIFADDQSYKTVGCYPESFPWVKTPALDRLAAGGVRFHAAYLGAWCMPSRASILTGRHPHGIESMRMASPYPASAYDPKECPFWPAEMRRQGYHTAQIGKWHTGIDSGWGRDWDHQIVWNRPLHPENAGAYYDRQLVAIDGQERWVDGYPADNYSQWAEEYIRGKNRNAEQPWFLWLCYGSIHGPSIPAERHRGRYAEAPVPRPADLFPPRPGKPAYLDRMQAWMRGDNGEVFAGASGESFGDVSRKMKQTFEGFVRQMNECVPAIDEGVERLMRALKETGQLDNTLILYSADQGFGMGEHGFRTKLGPYDATLRSPLIVSMPGLAKAGSVCEVPVNAPDIVATILAQSGVQVPWSVHGRDLSPLFKDPKAAWPHPCVYEFSGDQYGKPAREVVEETPEKAEYHRVPWYSAVVQGGWKLIHYWKPGVGDELYDLKNDPEELRNQIAEPAQAQRIEALRAALKADLQRTDGVRWENSAATIQ